MTRQEFLELPDTQKWEIVSHNLNDIAKIKGRLSELEKLIPAPKKYDTNSNPFKDLFGGKL